MTHSRTRSKTTYAKETTEPPPPYQQSMDDESRHNTHNGRSTIITHHHTRHMGGNHQLQQSAATPQMNIRKMEAFPQTPIDEELSLKPTTKPGFFDYRIDRHGKNKDEDKERMNDKNIIKSVDKDQKERFNKEKQMIIFDEEDNELKDFDTNDYKNIDEMNLAMRESRIDESDSNTLDLSDLHDPMVLPVTEGKNRNQQDIPYGLPVELMPIYPGGGSRFEDLEREKLEKNKMSQTKDTDDNGRRNEHDNDRQNEHNAAGLYSSSMSSFLMFTCSSQEPTVSGLINLIVYLIIRILVM